ncbi:zinc-ribbon domain-containing protein, partial [Acinetobacter baumannii]
PDHVWKATVVDRTGKDTDCPFCANQAVSVTNTLASQYPEIAAEWHRKRNGLLTPQDIVAGYSKKVWWQCGFDKTHEWQA